MPAAAASVAPTFTVVLSTSVDEGDLRAWFDAAQPGHSATYAIGLDLPRDAAGVQLARRLADGGRARLHQRRAGHDPRQWEWIIVKLGGEDDSRPTASLLEGRAARRAHGSCCTQHPVTEREIAALLELLAELPRWADNWAVCPRNADLAKELGLGAGGDARRRARYLLDRLRGAGRIELEHTGRDSARRVRVVR